MKLHPRHIPCEQAKREAQEFLADLAKKHRLTFSEELTLLAELLHNALSLTVKHERRKKENSHEHP